MTLSKRDRNRIEQRARILDCARILFATRGFEEVTMLEIARAAGVARATVFNYFASKHALVDSITEDVFAYYNGMLDRALADEESSTPALVRGLFHDMGRGIERLHSFYRGVFREITKIQVGVVEGGAASGPRRAALARLTELLARGQKRGDICSEHAAQDLAGAFNSLANGTIISWLYDDPDLPLHHRMLRAAEIFLGPVAVESEGDRLAPLPNLLAPQLGDVEPHES